VQFDACVYAEAMRHAEQLKPMMADVSRELNEATGQGQNLLFEGAQGTCSMWTMAPIPTSHPATVSPATQPQGSGVGPGMLHYILASPKRIARGWVADLSLPNLDWETPGTPGYHMSTVGAEKGVTTGRSRRCGWFDAALLKRSAQVNGLTGLCITKLDVLDGLKELVAVHRLHELDGERIDLLPMGADDIARCTPIYETLPGWSDSTVE
jgi:adenylosuccinate synthase